MRRSWLISAVVVSATSVACTALLGDYTTSGAVVEPGSEGGTSGGPGTCTGTQKSCNGACVEKSDPNAGCATAVCTPCAAATNAAPACKAGGCSFTCNAGFADCDGNPANGCEGKTSSDVNNCGKCGDPCGTANTSPANPPLCMAGKCTFACKLTFKHCSAVNATGCETNVDNDPLNCGACGHSCLGGACKLQKCEPFQLASTVQPSGLAVDMTHVYFTSPSQGQIARVQRDGKCTPVAPCPQAFAGSAALDPLTGQTRGPTAIVSDGSFVYWTADAAGLLVKRPASLPPGVLTTLGPAVSTNPGYLALGGGKLWWTTGFGAAGTDPAPHLRSANLDGTGLVAVANFQSPVSTSKGRGGVATDATSVYWASETEGAVYHAAFTDPPCTEGSLGAVPCKAYGSASSPYGVAVDDSFVYWTEPTSGTVKKAPKAGGQSSVVATNQDLPQAIAVLGTFVYWGNASTTGATAGTIRRAPQVAATCDAALCEHVADAAAPDAVIAADDGIYWTNNSATTGAVFRLAK
jgi:hypothetical protein